ncbi:MAG TPA: hypothetical protein VEJ39_09180 [Candidatus Acidoferrales bacterium]|nr:hypothetical protein [Candidatus Acidoferrales bacterium]
MYRWAYLAILTILLAGPDTPKTYDIRPSPLLPMTPGSLPPDNFPPSPPGEFISVTQTAASGKQVPLKQTSRLEIVRYISGEFARADKPIPGARKGFRVVVGKPVDDKALKYALANTGIAVNPGDTVQITRVEFREREIAIDLNGGSAHHFHLRDHLQVGVGGGPGMPVGTTTTTTGAEQRAGATLILDYRKPLPDMSPDDLKRDLSNFLDFEKEKSAAVNWIDTLPPEIKKAIQDNRAVVGMDHDMVIAALGRPDHKVREKNENGDETEDWIYGNPPSKTIFVTFIGDKVTKVREFN